MQITGMKYGHQLLRLVDFPVAETLPASASLDEVSGLIQRHGGKCVVKPVFLGGIGKKGKAGLVRIVNNPYEAMVAKRDLYFAVHEQGSRSVQANGVTFEGFIPSEVEIYFNISASTLYRAPVMTLTTEGGVEVEEIPPERKRVISFNPATGIKAFHVHDALRELGCPAQYISPLVQHLPKLWQLYDHYGLTVLELNPIRMARQNGRYLPIACDIKAAFDLDNPAWRRLGFPEEIFSTEMSRFEAEINLLRTHQGQSDVVEINPKGSILPFMFGGGANSVTTEILGDRAILSSDFGGNPPYEKMKAIADITLRHWLPQARVLLIIGGRANNTDIFTTFKGIFDALRERSELNPNIQVVVGRGGPRLVEGLTYARDILDRLQIPYAFFGFDSSMVSVIHYALELDRWLAQNGPSVAASKS
ncbi:MAG: ATP citrate lyase citrate-binding domain-containing protein [Trichloromonadaceae bacterium]